MKKTSAKPATTTQPEYKKVDVKERASQFIEKLLSNLEKGTIEDWKKTWKTLGRQKRANEFCNAEHKTAYSGANSLIVLIDCMINGYTETRYLTYHQVLAVAKKNNREGFLSGENCKKYINLYFAFPNIQEVENKETGKKEEKFCGMIWSQTKNLYNIELTDLSDLFEKAEPIETPTRPLSEREQEAIQILNSPYLAPYKEGEQDRAYYVPSLDKILVPTLGQFNTNADFIGTLAHEQAHATGHKSRIGRNMGGEKGSKLYAKEELIAETTAFMFNANFELDGEDNSMAYVLGWLSRVRGEVPADVIFTALSHADKAFHFIMTGEVKSNEKKDKE